jgi:hypothetical protein
MREFPERCDLVSNLVTSSYREFSHSTRYVRLIADGTIRETSAPRRNWSGLRAVLCVILQMFRASLDWLQYTSSDMNSVCVCVCVCSACNCASIRSRLSTCILNKLHKNCVNWGLHGGENWSRSFFLIVALCGMVVRNHSFGGPFCLHLQGLNVWWRRSSHRSVTLP